MPRPGVITAATVASTSPLTIRELANADPLPAKLMPGTSYTPTTSTPGSRVLVTFVSGTYYVLGGA